MAALRVLFMGTAELSCHSLAALTESPAVQVVAVVTQPDRPKGRDLKLQPSPVKVLGLSAKLPVLQPERARSEEFLEALRALRPDLIAVAAYGQILPVSILDLPRFGCLNVHTSLLPRYRGRLAFHGGLSTQRTLPRGSVAEVRAVGKAGGWLIRFAAPADRRCREIVRFCRRRSHAARRR